MEGPVAGGLLLTGQPGFEGRRGRGGDQVLWGKEERVERCCHDWMLPCGLTEVLSPGPRWGETSGVQLIT